MRAVYVTQIYFHNFRHASCHSILNQKRINAIMKRILLHQHREGSQASRKTAVPGALCPGPRGLTFWLPGAIKRRQRDKYTASRKTSRALSPLLSGTLSSLPVKHMQHSTPKGVLPPIIQNCS